MTKGLYVRQPDTLEKMRQNALKYHRTHSHPRGMLGKKQSEAFKKRMSLKSKEMWKDPNSKLNSPEHRQHLSDRDVQMHKDGILGGNNAYSNARRGWYENGEKKYFMRSSWEINYACYLDFLIKQKQIKDWKYEADTFWFEKIRRGVRSYMPDFKVFNTNGTIEYHEVKGYMDNRSATKLKRMKKYYPEVKMVLIDEEQYKAIMKHKKLYKIYE